MTLGGCIAAARKSIGTIIGPKGKMELVEDNGGIESGEQVRRVVIVNSVGDKVDAQEQATLQSSIESKLAAANLFGGGAADLTLTMNLTRYTDRPAKKVLNLKATLTRGDTTVGIAKLTADLNGFGDHEEVADAIGKASVEFLEHLGAN
jgi:hypothetical protein